MNIRYLKNSEIDRQKWDWCIRNALNGNIYGFSWYLDAVCQGWEALIAGDYKEVMPLTGRRKFGTSYLFRPLLNQQLGLFFLNLPEKTRINEFLKAIPKKYKLVEISLNKYNDPNQDGYVISKHNCFELDLIPEYLALTDNYNQNTKRALVKAGKSGLIEDHNIAADDFLELLWKDQGAGAAILREPNNLKLLHRLLAAMQQRNAGRIIGIRNENNKLIAACLFGVSHHKWYYLAPVSVEEAKEKRALFLLVDFVIRKNCGELTTLDFEGSDIPGVARFYAGFGAKSYEYSSVRQNSLPWPFKLLKS